MNNNINLVKPWNTLWSELTKWAPGLGVFLAVVGLLIIVVAVIKWAWDKRRGNGGGGKGFPTMLVVIGIALAGPTVVIPIVLTVIQMLFGIGVNMINWLTTTLKP